MNTLKQTVLYFQVCYLISLATAFFSLNDDMFLKILKLHFAFYKLDLYYCHLENKIRFH